MSKTSTSIKAGRATAASTAAVPAAREHARVAVDRQYLTPRQAAQYLNVGYSTLGISRMQGHGPDYIKWGPNIRYSISALESWMSSQEVTPVPKPVKKRGRPRKDASAGEPRRA